MPAHPPGADPARFAAAISRFDAENARDPNTVMVHGMASPHELVYAQWLTDWVLRLCPQASEALLLAARCQHLCRWRIPRTSYPATRSGYLRWREDLKQFHARRAGEILREVGYDESVIARVRSLNLKQNPAADPEVRILEDALCLVFFKYQLEDLARKTPEAKLLGALRKSWGKMSPAGRAEADRLPLRPPLRALLDRALAGTVESGPATPPPPAT